MSTAEIRPPDGSGSAKHARNERVHQVDGTGPIGLPAGLTKPGADAVAAIPAPRTSGGRHGIPVSYATGPIAVPDAALAAAAATNATAFAAIYRRYGDALHSFCLGMLRDPDAAADCVHDVFVTAACRLGQLREYDKLRPWLYAIARHEALRRLKRSRREQATDELPDAPDPAEGPDHDLSRRELTELVTAACSGLSDRERAVLELHYRQGLDGPALADALGVSATNANTLVGRLRGTVERSLAALLVARHQGDRCAELATVLAGWDGQLTVLMRKRIARHLDHCSTCTQARRELVNPRALLASAPIAIPAPDWLEHHVLDAATPLVGSSAPASVGGGASAAKGASWWPAGLGASTPTIIAAAAPVAAAVVMLPILLLGDFSAGPTAAATSASAADAAPELLEPNSTTTATSARRGFAIDPSTTRFAPTANPRTAPGSPGATNAPTPGEQQAPGAVGSPGVRGSGGASAGPTAFGPAPQPRGRRGTHKDAPPESTHDPRTHGQPTDPRESGGQPRIWSGPIATTAPPAGPDN